MGFERSIGNWELAQFVIAYVDLDRLEVESPRVLRLEGSKCQHGASRLPGGCRFEVRVARHVRPPKAVLSANASVSVFCDVTQDLSRRVRILKPLQNLGVFYPSRWLRLAQGFA